MIPSTDQDRSVAFYESLGFKKRMDIPFGDRQRWVEIYPPSGPTGIALVPWRPGEPRSIQTGILLTANDIVEATRPARPEISGDIVRRDRRTS